MRKLGKNNTLVGLDIGTASVAAVEVGVNGTARVLQTGVAELPVGVSQDGEVIDPAALGEALKDLFSANGLGRDVRIGLANQRVVVRTLRMPRIEEGGELESAVRFMAQDHVPMPLDNAIVDWQILDPDPEAAASGSMDVAVVAAREDVVAPLLEAVRAAGLRLAGLDVAAFGMIRALSSGRDAARPPDGTLGGNEADVAPAGTSARMYCNFGDVTNLAVARGSSCLFTRVSSFGLEGVAQRLAERRGMTLEHARQWILHVGLEQSADAIQGDPDTVRAAREALEEGVVKLASELRLSLDYYGTQDGAVSIEEIVACGQGAAISGLAAGLERELGYATRVARPLALAGLPDAEASRLTVPFGLALDD